MTATQLLCANNLWPQQRENNLDDAPMQPFHSIDAGRLSDFGFRAGSPLASNGASGLVGRDCIECNCQPRLLAAKG